MTAIGDHAFYHCQRLTNVTIPNSVTAIGDCAFECCFGLTNIIIPNSVTTIGDYAFCMCHNLTSITIPNSVTSIGRSAFIDCSRLSNFIIPNSVTTIEDFTFRGCGFTSITIHNSVTAIGFGAFGLSFSRCSKLEKLIIEDGTETLHLEYADDEYDKPVGLFYYCALTSLYLGRNLSYDNKKNKSPFGNITTLKEVTLGKSVTSVDKYAFYGCSGLTELYSLNPIPPTVDASNFTNVQYMNLNVYVPQGSLAAYQNADVWKNFWNLQEFVPSGVETVKEDGKNAADTYYDIQGRRLNEPKNGLNIINGKKVLIRK